MSPYYLIFITTLFIGLSVAEPNCRAASVQSSMGGTYHGTTDVMVNANEHLSCPTTLQFDPNTNTATVTVNYRGTDMTSKISGTLRGGVFRGRSEGRFFGLVYVQATNYVLKFNRESGTVRATSWLVNPASGSDNKPETDIYRRTPPRTEVSEGREEESSAGSEDDNSGDSNRSGKNKDGSKKRESAARTSHLKGDAGREARTSLERTKVFRLDSTVSKPKPANPASHKK